ncbi:uncharacterized protein EDB91DRAFT_1055957 [Suillus paluster]|uniref:uncharacterized protein n=1 Tax=Suillus paluster TaxID=48578 RepID=UPI001B870904|nr:uncharacterized protein EDB91DRAFT_1055957 [Suillus paluster]KAG1735960.1 hypothetical protein EDB91DRAFT_1055957 [Suillus paluster]
MLEYASIHRAAVDTMTQRRDLRDLELMDYEWKIVGQLWDVLKILKDATMFFSRTVPNLATVIPAMDLIDEKLTTYSLDDKYLPAIHAAVGLAKKTLNRYYQLTDHSDMYCIAMILHPHHKLVYFKVVNWENEWIDAAEKLLRDEFERSYLDSSLVESDKDSTVIPSAASVSFVLSPNHVLY